MPRPRARLRARSGAPVLAFVLSLAADAAAKPGDPADRGLDLFVHAPKTVRAGDAAMLDFLAYGFVTVTDPKPLEKATIIAAWDPESLGAGVATAPGEVTGTTDARGHVTLSVPMPDGDARKLTLLVSLRHGEHVRTRKLTVQRSPRHRVSLRLADAHVVPGSRVPAWVTVNDTRTGDAVKGAAVDVALREGELARQTERVVTDGTGLAQTSLWIPAKATGSPQISLRARLPTANGGFVDDTVGVTLREERPATPKLDVSWHERQLRPGEVGHATIHVLDAATEPIANHPVRYWTGPRGTSPPADEKEWRDVSKPAVTDGLGGIEVTAQAPRVVAANGSTLTIVVRTELESNTVEAKDEAQVGVPIAEATLELEGTEVVPGAGQRAYLSVTDGEKGVAGTFTVEADGIKTQVTTDQYGDAELTWNVPEDVGATRGVGPCAGGVAANVTVRQTTPIPALSRHPEPFELCVRVQRDRAALLRPSVHVARVGDKPTVKIEGGKRAFHGAGSIAVTDADGTGTTQWSASDEATIDLTNVKEGLHEISFAAARLDKTAETSSAQILVVPKVLPKLGAKLATGNKLLPGNDVDVDVVLDDGHGHPLVGNVSAVVIDKEGGGSIEGLKRLDTRLGLCSRVGVSEDRCDGFLEGDPRAEVLRRSSLATRAGTPLAPELDPAAEAKGNLKETFSNVLHSLEGAVFQARTPESLRDVRRRENGRWVFNPELMTLVTAAMNDAPTTPGGDPFRLDDLMAIDPQVTFDNVARRVTRLKLFNVLSTIRSFVQEEHIGPNEPVLRDPSSLLRRLARENKVEPHGLLDPWGGTFEFVRAGGPGLPFLTVTPGWELHAPGPDGRIGTADDVRDPFERVVRSGSPYADAMGEDEIVDSRLDMRVGDATVSKWQSMFDRLTGQVLGNLTGTGGGSGFGNGHGRLGGAHGTKAPQLRMGYGIATNTTRWTDPVRTDANGRARVRVHLGDYETTWQIALLARSDSGQSALAAVDAPAFLPVSARLDLGRKLTAGDTVAGRIVVRNRTPQPKTVSLDVGAEGGLGLAAGQPRTINVDVPANAVRSVYAKYVATSEGTGRATVLLRGPGMEGDRTAEEIGIAAAGEALVISTSLEVPKSARLRVPVPAGWTLRDHARVVVESGLESALLDALASFEPEPGQSYEALADALEVAARLEKMAEAKNDKALVTRTRDAAALARAYLWDGQKTSKRMQLAFRRSGLFPAPDDDGKSKKLHAGEALCPQKGEAELVPVHLLLETEPAAGADGPASCFTSLVANLTSKAPLDLARATLALAERPHRTALAENQARELAKATFADGGHEPVFDGPRAEKAIVLAALARTATAWSKDEGAGRRIAQTILTLRDARGGYGSSEATRDVVRAFIALEAQSPPKAAHVIVKENGQARPAIDVAARGKAIIDLGANTTVADVFVTGGPVVARLERPVLRKYLAAPESSLAPVQVAIEWPPDAKANATGVVHVSYTATAGREVSVHTQVPLPPGVELAAPVKNITLRQGVVHLDQTVNGSETVSIPVRFSLPGTMLVPEAETRTTSEEQPRTLSPARWLTVH